MDLFLSQHTILFAFEYHKFNWSYQNKLLGSTSKHNIFLISIRQYLLQINHDVTTDTSMARYFRFFKFFSIQPIYKLSSNSTTVFFDNSEKQIYQETILICSMFIQVPKCTDHNNIGISRKTFSLARDNNKCTYKYCHKTNTLQIENTNINAVRPSHIMYVSHH